MSYPIDNLVYKYGNNSNQLVAVSDQTYSTEGFRDGNQNGADFSYDDYGNMTSDLNKKIHAVYYNHLNLPVKIKFNGVGENEINYLYNALGVKVGKNVKSTTSQTGTVETQTDYLNGFQYLTPPTGTGGLQFFPTAEGYVSVVDGQKFNYVYNYTDHLGNIRVSYSFDQADQQLKILEENHYYPFGLKHSNYNVDKVDFDRDVNGGIFAVLKPVERGKYQYKYNGKEFQDELSLNWYDYQARNYDPAIGRWMNIDPKADKYYNISPYVYVADNPMLFIDPNGKEIIVANNGDQAKVLKMINSQAVGTFKFDEKGKLYLAKAGGDASKYSQYYTDKLVEAIGKGEKIEITLAQNINVKAPDGERTIDLETREFGGAVTFGKEGGNQNVVVSENNWTAEKDVDGNQLTQTPADKLMHELVGHAIPHIVGSDTGDGIKNENKVREQLKVVKRKEVAHDE